MKDEPTQGVAGTQRHDFDVDVVRERLPWADSEQLRRMLDEALHVVCGLRSTVEVMAAASEVALQASRNQWTGRS